MIKKLIPLILFLIVILTACTKTVEEPVTPDITLDISTLKDDDGNYNFCGIYVGDSQKEVAEKLCQDFDENSELKDFYAYSNAIAYDGYNFVVAINFDDNGLKEVFVNFNDIPNATEELEVFLTDMVADFTECFGEPVVDTADYEGSILEVLRWTDENGNMLSLQSQIVDSKPVFAIYLQ